MKITDARKLSDSVTKQYGNADKVATFRVEFKLRTRTPFVYVDAANMFDAIDKAATVLRSELGVSRLKVVRAIEFNEDGTRKASGRFQ